MIAARPRAAPNDEKGQIPHSPTSLSASRRWDDEVPGWLEGVLIGAVSRVVAIVVILVVVPTAHGSIPATPPFGMWDGWWYEAIAAGGYHSGPLLQTTDGFTYYDFAFFPLWPALIRVLSLGNAAWMTVVAPIASNLLFVLASSLIEVTFIRATTRSVARWGTLFCAFGPASFVYSLAYSEPLFLVLIATTFLLSGTGRAVPAAAAMVTRLSSAMMVLPALVDVTSAATRKRGVVVSAAVLGGFAAWWGFIVYLTGDPLGYLLGSPSWYDFAGGRAHTGLASIIDAGPAAIIVVPPLLLLVAGSIALIWPPLGMVAAAPGRRFRVGLAVYSLGCIATTLLVTTSSMPRLASAGFPAFAGLALLARRGSIRVLILGCFIVIDATLAWAVFAVGFVP